ncbi:plasmid replication initiator TrfA [Burkholderia pseudomallei]|uniref:plasmid replication initiator TrfA n=1 Tax=Burkholderia pseudomallei TaxID=28450 RepID=UPI0022EB078C|nr:plasmid replication initiator TrfA [Burkholderia pseudomallei]
MAQTILPKPDVETTTAPKKTRRKQPAATEATLPDSPLAKFPNLVRSAAEAEARLAAKAIDTTPEPMETQLALPFWPDGFRALPNEIFRSSLFNARNKRLKREFLREAEIFVIGTGRVTYTGEELRQDDETVWLQLIQLAKAQPLGSVVQFTAGSFVKAVGWPRTKESYERLRACLIRMQATSLQVVAKRLGTDSGKGLSMIPEFEWQDRETEKPLRQYKVVLAPALVKLFGGKGHFTRVEWDQRLKLPAGLATWLHGYFASHREPYPIRLDSIRQGAGLTTARLAHVRELVEDALDELKRVNFLDAWRIDGPDKDLVSVQRSNIAMPELELDE